MDLIFDETSLDVPEEFDSCQSTDRKSVNSPKTKTSKL